MNFNFFRQNLSGFQPQFWVYFVLSYSDELWEAHSRLSCQNKPKTTLHDYTRGPVPFPARQVRYIAENQSISKTLTFCTHLQTPKSLYHKFKFQKIADFKKTSRLNLFSVAQAKSEPVPILHREFHVGMPKLLK